MGQSSSPDGKQRKFAALDDALTREAKVMVIPPLRVSVGEVRRCTRNALLGVWHGA